MNMQLQIPDFVDQFASFPGTRYMGSKNKIISEIWLYLKDLPFGNFLDAFGGSNVVGYFMKCQGKRVISNDFLAFSHIISKAIIENSNIILDEIDIDFLLKGNENNQFIKKTFKGIFYSDIENEFLDRVRKNISELENEYKTALALSALVRACMKKRSRGIFTFVGERYDDGRLDMKKSLREHFIESVNIFNKSVFDNGHLNQSFNQQSENLDCHADLVYFDPPYFSPKSDNDYVRRYHFVEGLVKNWHGVKMQEHSVVKKFESYKSPFAKRETAYDAFKNLFEKHKNSIIAISYSSNSLPTKDELIALLGQYKSDVSVYEINHTYSFGNQNHKIGNKNNRVKEFLFVGM
ncbi:MAG TPA: DNA adenine methylase [Mucilaginibacter sp.]|nr:DNA adenine methylase [Mucilaginibacter sp.]